jgi:tetratricopeptide (TPR) repeat protein
VRSFSRISLSVAALVLCALPVAAQRVSSSSSNGEQPAEETKSSSVVPRRDAAGSAVSLETNESLSEIAAALNACGYDNGLDTSLPVRAAIRAEMSAAVEGSPAARESRDAMCVSIKNHTLGGGQNLAQYVSLALFLTPPPELALSVPETEMPPDALQVEAVLPFIRDFAAKVQMRNIFARHRAAYEAAVLQVRESLTRMLLETNVYLHQPVSSYDGRRFMVLLEPLLSPQAVNARVYGTDYFLTASPANIAGQDPPRVSAGARSSVSDRAAGLQMDQVRHLYLLYTIDPIIYARSQATERLRPIIRAVSDAPIDFVYKNDVVAFTTECLIKAIEARLMDVGFPKPAKPNAGKQRTELDGYNQAVADYDRKAEAVRRHQVVVDEESGWVLTGSFYDKLAQQDREGISLKESIAEMVYGMDVVHETDRVKKIPFFAADSPQLVGGGGVSRGRAPRRSLSAMDQAELKLQKGDRMGAEDLADKELLANPSSGEALYVLARVKLMEGDPQGAYDRFTQVLAAAKDARTLAWSHVYLGRLYDTQQRPDRAKAVAEYKAALATPGLQMDVKAAAEAGIRKPFAPPKRTVTDSDQTPADDESLDPTGKKQKESYKPSEEVPPPANARPR